MIEFQNYEVKSEDHKRKAVFVYLQAFYISGQDNNLQNLLHFPPLYIRSLYEISKKEPTFLNLTQCSVSLSVTLHKTFGHETQTRNPKQQCRNSNPNMHKKFIIHFQLLHSNIMEALKLNGHPLTCPMPIIKLAQHYYCILMIRIAFYSGQHTYIHTYIHKHTYIHTYIHTYVNILAQGDVLLSKLLGQHM